MRIDVAAVIPARYGSTRFPGKPLFPILGRPMIAWVVEAAGRAEGIDGVYVATDSREIADAAETAGAGVIMTSPDCKSGTDRVAEAARTIGARVYLNVQGDEPAVDHRDLSRLAKVFDGDDPPPMATLARPLGPDADPSDPNLVKVVRNSLGDALYFSRSPIPFYRDATEEVRASLPTLLHVGVYGYTAEGLARFAAMAEGRLEAAEKLEQLRALEAGWRIRVIDAAGLPGVGVDRPEDISRAEKMLAERLALKTGET